MLFRLFSLLDLAANLHASFPAWPILDHLVKLALHLALGRVIPGQDVEVLYTRQMQVRTSKRRPNVAFDGEKRRMLAPLLFEIRPDALSIILPLTQMMKVPK